MTPQWIYAITSTVSASRDQVADPNKLVKVTDLLKASSLPLKDGDHDADDKFTERFVTLRTAKAGEFFAEYRLLRRTMTVTKASR